MKWFALVMTAILGLAAGFIIEIVLRPPPEFSFNQILMLNDQTNGLINLQLNQVLQRLPTVARIRVGLIHGPGTINKNNFRNYQFDVINLKSAPGKNPGPTLSDQSMEQWQDFIAPMLAGECTSMQTSDLTSKEPIDRMRALGSITFYGCPIRNHRGDLVGGIFAVWDEPNVTIKAADIYVILSDAATHIYNAIETRLEKSDRL